MSDKNYGFGINFETNARQAAQDIRELDKAQKEVEKTAEKNRTKTTKSSRRQMSFRDELMSELRIMRELQEKLNRVEEKGDRQREKSDKREISAGKIKLGQQKGLANGLAKTAAAAYSVYKIAQWSMSGLRNIASYEHGAIASLSPGMTPEKLGGIEFATKEYGGTIGSAASNTARLQNILNQRRMYGELGFDEMLAGRFPGLSSVFTNGRGRVATDVMQVMRNLNRFLQGRNYADQAAIVSGLGLSPDWIPLLTKSPSDYESSIATSTSQASTAVKDAEKAARIEAEKEKAQTWWNSIKTELVNWLTDGGENVPMMKALVAIGDTLPGIATALGTIATWKMFTGLIPKGIPTKPIVPITPGVKPTIPPVRTLPPGNFVKGIISGATSAEAIGGSIALAPFALTLGYMTARGIGEQKRRQSEYLAGFDLSKGKPTHDNIPGFINTKDITESETLKSLMIYEYGQGQKDRDFLSYVSGNRMIQSTSRDFSANVTVNIDAPGIDRTTWQSTADKLQQIAREEIIKAFEVMDEEYSTPWEK